jgi:hypothetical protein
VVRRFQGRWRRNSRRIDEKLHRIAVGSGLERTGPIEPHQPMRQAPDLQNEGSDLVAAPRRSISGLDGQSGGFDDAAQLRSDIAASA